MQGPSLFRSLLAWGDLGWLRSRFGCVTFGEDVDLSQPSLMRARVGAASDACVVNRAVAPYEIVAMNSQW